MLLHDPACQRKDGGEIFAACSVSECCSDWSCSSRHSAASRAPTPVGSRLCSKRSAVRSSSGSTAASGGHIVSSSSSVGCRYPSSSSASTSNSTSARSRCEAWHAICARKCSRSDSVVPTQLVGLVSSSSVASLLPRHSISEPPSIGESGNSVGSAGAGASCPFDGSATASDSGTSAAIEPSGLTRIASACGSSSRSSSGLSASA